MNKLKILSIDGGGARGIIPARILQAVEEKAGKPINELFDVIVGTSTGALIALCLAAANKKYNASDIVKIYRDESKNIFKRSLWYTLKSGNGLLGPKYPREYLDGLLKSLFMHPVLKTQTMLSSASCNVIIPTYSLTKGGPVVYSSNKARNNPMFDKKMFEIAAAATAAPTYFAPAYVSQFMRFSDLEIDGGVWVNNPEMLGITEALKIKEDVSVDNVSILSLGTGCCKNVSYSDKFLKFGKLGWLEYGLIDIIINASMQEDSILTNAFFNRAYRPQIVLGKNYELDDVSEKTLKELLKISEEIIRDEGKLRSIMDIVNLR